MAFGNAIRSWFEATCLTSFRSPSFARAAALAAIATLGVTGCGDDQDPAGARELYDRLQSAKYREWQRAPGYETRQPTRAPHGKQVDIYVNDVVKDALAAGRPLDAWPKGSIIAKDGWDGSDLDILAAMEKRDDGWFWVEWNGSGESLYSGKPNICIDCHKSGEDLVRAFPLPK